MRGLVGLAWALTVVGACAAHALAGSGHEGVLGLQAPPGRRCAPTEDIPVAGLDLNAEERELLPHICWHDDLVHTLNFRRGIPPGVNCSAVQWCDGDVCSEVCARGSVRLERWLSAALRTQARLARSLPLCYAHLLGTHNSGITLADGYGNLDPYYQSFFSYIKWAADVGDALLRTNDQWLSLTDQLEMGVRSVELDTHWIGGSLRIAHCGGLHVPELNALVRALNLVARLLHRRIRWDTETLGCVPSLSSIPAMEQRTLRDALGEIRSWMDRPENGEEFVVLYFDDQPNLAEWGVVPSLIEDVLSAFPAEWIYTTEDRATAEATGAGWPALEELVRSGRRLLLVSGADYGPAMEPLVFARGRAVCRWSEPDLRYVSGAPACEVRRPGPDDPAPLPSSPRPLFDGVLTRVSSCELEYGPLSNCDFQWRGVNSPVLDEDTLPPMLSCGLNLPAPDLLTPSRAAAAVWSWAPGHPFQTEEAGPQPGARTARRQRLGPEGGDGMAEEAACAAISAADGRWRAVPCDQELPTLCRHASAPPAGDPVWVLGSGPRGACPEGHAFDVPRHPRANYRLALQLREAGAPAAWLPMQAPSWEPPGAADPLPQRAGTAAA